MLKQLLEKQSAEFDEKFIGNSLDRLKQYPELEWLQKGIVELKSITLSQKIEILENVAEKLKEIMNKSKTEIGVSRTLTNFLSTLQEVIKTIR